MTLVWGFILTHVLSYVASSMIGTPYDFKTASILGIFLVILICLLGSVSNVQSAEKQ